jgi:uncharacterized MAPEG superfamily protein
MHTDLEDSRVTTAHLCVLIACLLPIVCAGLAKSPGFGKPRREGGFDNHHPRQWLAGLGGWQARANAAQQNSFEALPIFIAGVLIAERLGMATGRVDLLAIVFVLARLGYIACYVADLATLRSLLWVVGLGASIALFFPG